MNTFHLDLVSSELKLILEALIEMDSRMSNLCEISSDENEISEVGNDLVELRLLLNPLKEKAINQFGSNILNFSRELL